jgi:hemerythrin superfamily protein
MPSQQSRLRSGDNGRYIGAAAIGAVVAVAALLGRKAAHQAMTTARGTWIDAIKAEHEAARALFEAIEATDDTASIRRPMLFMKLKAALTKHAFQEENVLYPALHTHGETEPAEGLEHDHGRLKTLLFELSSISVTEPAWMSKIVELRSEFENHVQEEEEEIFPALYADLSDEENRRLMTQMHKAGIKLA